jgi:hypothetical protein
MTPEQGPERRVSIVNTHRDTATPLEIREKSWHSCAGGANSPY